MEQRFDITELIPDGYKAMFAVHKYVQSAGLDLGLLELVRLRVSQTNGCGFCVAISARERAALAWADAVTALAGQEVPDKVYDHVKTEFSPEEIANLTLCIGEINTWNRLMIASRTPPAL
jgi:alkylhydroperoxidase family enzyme